MCDNQLSSCRVPPMLVTRNYVKMLCKTICRGIGGSPGENLGQEASFELSSAGHFCLLKASKARYPWTWIIHFDR